MKRLSFLLYIYFLSLSINGKTIHIVSQLGLREQLCIPNAEYVVSVNIDLNGDTIKLPPNSVLRFKGRYKIKNAVLVGDNSSIIASPIMIFENVLIDGYWKNTKVYGQWFNTNQYDTHHNIFFKNLMKLCGGTCKTHLYLGKGEYCVAAIPYSAPIVVPSHTVWHNSATIRMLPCEYEKYSMVLLAGVSDVTIDGGRFIGDAETHSGHVGEWGHGIKCGGARNIVLANLTCENFWGDGIDLIEGYVNKGDTAINCDGVKIQNVKCLRNRRQGMSIEAAHNVIVCNSEFAYTGTLKFTEPGAGIDIEPWCTNNEKIKFVTLRNCYMHDNVGLDFQCEPNLLLRENYASLVNNIVMKGCTMGNSRIQLTNGIRILKCVINQELLIRNVISVNFEGSFVRNFRRQDSCEKLVFKNCRGFLNE